MLALVVRQQNTNLSSVERTTNSQSFGFSKLGCRASHSGCRVYLGKDGEDAVRARSDHVEDAAAREERARVPGGNPGANLKSISHRCHPILVAFVWELTKETIHLPLGCVQGGVPPLD